MKYEFIVKMVTIDDKQSEIDEALLGYMESNVITSVIL